MKNILLIRHGQSEWNKLNLFTGFKNIELSEQGIDCLLYTSPSPRD